MEIYRRLLGELAFANTIFVTTHWDPLHGDDYREAVERETVLSQESGFFAPFLVQGAKIVRFLGGKESAEEIMVASRRDRKIPLQIQKELVEQQLGLQFTQAGQLVDMSAQELTGFYELTLRQLQAAVRQRRHGTERDPDVWREDTNRQIAAYRELLYHTQRDRKVLTIGFMPNLALRILKLFNPSLQRPF